MLVHFQLLLSRDWHEYYGIISTPFQSVKGIWAVRHFWNIHIQTKGSPICQPPRRLPFHKRTEVQNLLSDMVKKGIVEPSDSPWSSPIVLVKKKDGSTRFCVDFRQLNSVTCKDAQPIPRIDDTLDSLSGSCWFSTLDLASGYWQVEMKESAW